jgi:hypothetical protein
MEDQMNNVIDHRGHQERRQSDSFLPAGSFDRRTVAERRLPEMTVLRLSDMDWQRYFGPSPESSEKSASRSVAEADVLNKLRNDQ